MAEKTLVSSALDLHILAIEDERENDGKYHPSSMFNCDRSTILAVRGTKITNPADAEAKRRFRLGHMIHELVQDAMPGHPLVRNAYSEFLVDIPSLNIMGHGDVLVELMDDSWIVIEIKSTKSLKYTPKEDHLKQASVYAMGARDFGVDVTTTSYRDDDGNLLPEIAQGGIGIEPLGLKLSGILLVYLEKVNLGIKEYWYPYKPSWRKDIEKKVAELDGYRANPETIPPPLPKKHWYPAYCNFLGSGLCCGDPEMEGSEW